jgi:hypothetical protein
MIFKYARRFYVDFDFFVDSVVNCRHDGTMSPALQTREELKVWTRRITKALKAETSGAKVKGNVVRFDREVQPRNVAHLLNVAMAKDPYTDYDMGVNRVPYARVYVLRDGLSEPEFGDPYVSTALGWEDANAPNVDDLMADLDREFSYRLEAESYARILREKLEKAEVELAELKAKAVEGPKKKRKASNADLPLHLRSMLNDP